MKQDCLLPEIAVPMDVLSDTKISQARQIVVPNQKSTLQSLLLWLKLGYPSDLKSNCTLMIVAFKFQILIIL
jgi:hypothetical protein